MISDTAIIGAENCPPEIARCGDLPWNFVGEIGVLPSYPTSLTARCGPCNRLTFAPPFTAEAIQHQRQQLVDLPAYVFINDDLLVIRIWFGQCPKCGAVYWARQGPPYRRLSYRSPVGV